MKEGLDRYGGLGKPERRRELDIREDPLKAAMSAYRAWLAMVGKSGYSSGWFAFDYGITESFYREAAGLVMPKTRSFAGLGKKRLKKMVSEILSDDDVPAGLFLSALQNETDMEEVSGRYFTPVAGYRLGEGKRLIAKKGSRIQNLGAFGKGNIVSYGDSTNLALNASGGVQVNFGGAVIFALGAKGGVQVNFGDVPLMMAERSYGGVQVNFGHIGSFGGISRGGVRIDCSGRDLDGKHVDYVKRDESMLLKLAYPGISPKDMGTVDGLLKRMGEKVKEVETLKRFSKSSEGVSEAIGQYDWKAFEEEMAGIDRQVKEAVGLA